MRPSMLGAKQLPERTISSDKRLISDVRLVSARCGKRDYPGFVNPRLPDALPQMWGVKRQYPAVRVQLAKRGVDSA